MVRYVGSRLLQAIWVVWAAFTVSFVVLYLLPADPVSMAADGAGTGTPVDKAAIAEMQARYGLDKPLWEQYLSALGNAVTGDLGRSINTGQPVTEAIGDAIPATLGLAGLALLFAVAGGTAIAFAATYTRRAWLRNTLAALPPLGVSVPTFWTGLLLLQLFSFRLHWFPAFGGTGLRGTLLPALTLALPIGAVIAQVLAAGLAQTWRQPFTEVALAKGGSRWWVQRRHVARLASVPAFTIAGVLAGTMLAGSVVVESVFARAGVGRLTQTAVLNQDIPVVQGVVLLSALIFVLVNLAVDLIYPLIDPRIAGVGTTCATTAGGDAADTGAPATDTTRPASAGPEPVSAVSATGWQPSGATRDSEGVQHG
ncbi:ABC transporter permease [Nocardia asteroides]|uniref:ABC transporter permease n=1 Tax=Nocardia asteroides TaxID=1824 RepID=UPI001E614CA3|nr:ABC transporter permease [Nocardia asteroides]UGT54523.1 ABC transporter permease [Nocardia asteroides]